MTEGIFTAFAALLVGFFFGRVFTLLREKKPARATVASVTRLLFLVITFCALAWVFLSYGIAIYSAVALGQVYTMAELAEPAITSLLCAVALKVLENIFEHNDGALFGHSREKKENEE